MKNYNSTCSISNLKSNFNICLASNYVPSSIPVTSHILFNLPNNATFPLTPTPHFTNKKKPTHLESGSYVFKPGWATLLNPFSSLRYSPFTAGN